MKLFLTEPLDAPTGEDPRMSNNQSISRRQFVTGTSGLLISRASEVHSQNPTASGSEDTRLALGGR